MSRLKWLTTLLHISYVLLMLGLVPGIGTVYSSEVFLPTGRDHLSGTSPVDSRFDVNYVQQVVERIVIETVDVQRAVNMEVAVNNPGINTRSLPDNQSESLGNLLAAGQNTIRAVSLNGMLNGQPCQVWMQLEGGAWFHAETAGVRQGDLQAAIVNFGVKDIAIGSNTVVGVDVLSRTNISSELRLERPCLDNVDDVIAAAIDIYLTEEKNALIAGALDAGFGQEIEIIEIVSGYGEDGHLGLGLIGVQHDLTTGQQTLWLPISSFEYERVTLPNGVTGFWDLLSDGTIRIGFEVLGVEVGLFMPGTGWVLSAEAPDDITPEELTQVMGGVLSIDDLGIVANLSLPVAIDELRPISLYNLRDVYSLDVIPAASIDAHLSDLQPFVEWDAPITIDVQSYPDNEYAAARRYYSDGILQSFARYELDNSINGAPYVDMFGAIGGGILSEDWGIEEFVVNGSIEKIVYLNVVTKDLQGEYVVVKVYFDNLRGVTMSYDPSHSGDSLAVLTERGITEFFSGLAETPRKVMFMLINSSGASPHLFGRSESWVVELASQGLNVPIMRFIRSLG